MLSSSAHLTVAHVPRDDDDATSSENVGRTTVEEQYEAAHLQPYVSLQLQQPSPVPPVMPPPASLLLRMREAAAAGDNVLPHSILTGDDEEELDERMEGYSDGSDADDSRGASINWPNNDSSVSERRSPSARSVSPPSFDGRSFRTVSGSGGRRFRPGYVLNHPLAQRRRFHASPPLVAEEELLPSSLEHHHNVPSHQRPAAAAAVTSAAATSAIATAVLGSSSPSLSEHDIKTFGGRLSPQSQHRHYPSLMITSAAQLPYCCTSDQSTTAKPTTTSAATVAVVAASLSNLKASIPRVTGGLYNASFELCTVPSTFRVRGRTHLNSIVDDDGDLDFDWTDFVNNAFAATPRPRGRHLYQLLNRDYAAAASDFGVNTNLLSVERRAVLMLVERMRMLEHNAERFMITEDEEDQEEDDHVPPNANRNHVNNGGRAAVFEVDSEEVSVDERQTNPRSEVLPLHAPPMTYIISSPSSAMSICSGDDQLSSITATTTATTRYAHPLFPVLVRQALVPAHVEFHSLSSTLRAHAAVQEAMRSQVVTETQYNNNNTNGDGEGGPFVWVRPLGLLVHFYDAPPEATLWSGTMGVVREEHVDPIVAAGARMHSPYSYAASAMFSMHVNVHPRFLEPTQLHQPPVVVSPTNYRRTNGGEERNSPSPPVPSAYRGSPPMDIALKDYWVHQTRSGDYLQRVVLPWYDRQQQQQPVVVVPSAVAASSAAPIAGSPIARPSSRTSLLSSLPSPARERLQGNNRTMTPTAVDAARAVMVPGGDFANRALEPTPPTPTTTDFSAMETTDRPLLEGGGYRYDDDDIDEERWVPSPSGSLLVVATPREVPPATSTLVECLHAPHPDLVMESANDDDGEVGRTTTPTPPRVQRLGHRTSWRRRRRYHRAQAAVIPTDIWLHVLYTFVPRCDFAPVRLVCTTFNQLITMRCSFWHSRVPFQFRRTWMTFNNSDNDVLSISGHGDNFEEATIKKTFDRCLVHNIVSAVEFGELHAEALRDARCQKGCCYEMWRLKAHEAQAELGDAVSDGLAVGAAQGFIRSIMLPMLGPSALFYDTEFTLPRQKFILSLTILLIIALAISSNLVGVLIFNSVTDLTTTQSQYTALIRSSSTPTTTSGSVLAGVFNAGAPSSETGFTVVSTILVPFWVLCLLSYAMLYRCLCWSSTEVVAVSVMQMVLVQLSIILVVVYCVESWEASFVSCMVPAMIAALWSVVASVWTLKHKLYQARLSIGAGSHRASAADVLNDDGGRRSSWFRLCSSVWVAQDVLRVIVAASILVFAVLLPMELDATYRKADQNGGTIVFGTSGSTNAPPSTIVPPPPLSTTTAAPPADPSSPPTPIPPRQQLFTLSSATSSYRLALTTQAIVSHALVPLFIGLAAWLGMILWSIRCLGFWQLLHDAPLVTWSLSGYTISLVLSLLWIVLAMSMAKLEVSRRSSTTIVIPSSSSSSTSGLSAGTFDLIAPLLPMPSSLIHVLFQCIVAIIAMSTSLNAVACYLHSAFPGTRLARQSASLFLGV